MGQQDLPESFGRRLLPWNGQAMIVRLPALQAGVGIEKDNSKGKSVEREILYFGNKSPERSSLLGSGANWSRLAPQGDVTWLKRALRIVDRD